MLTSIAVEVRAAMTKNQATASGTCAPPTISKMTNTVTKATASMPNRTNPLLA